MEDSTMAKLIEAATRVEEDSCFTIEVLTMGIRIRYTFLHATPPNPPQYMTLDNITTWESLALANINPLLGAIDMLLEAIREYKDVRKTPS